IAGVTLPETSSSQGLLVLYFFRDGFCLQEKQQVVSASRFGIGARHVEAAEGMSADHRAGAFAIQIKIAYVEGFLSFFELGGIFRVDAAREAELCVVGDFEGLIEITRFDDRQNGAE